MKYKYLLRVIPLGIIALILGKYMDLGNEPANITVSLLIIVVLAVALGYIFQNKSKAS